MRARWLVLATSVAGIWTLEACGEDAGAVEAGAEAAAVDAAPERGPPAVPTIATEPNLKIAFIGDTASGANFKRVLQLIEREKAAAIMIQGDLIYDRATSTEWFAAIDETITIPYFVARGNHDLVWQPLGEGLKLRMDKWGTPSEHNDATLKNYSVVYKGLRMVMVDQVDTEDPTRAEYVAARLHDDPHIWRICSWHKNQRASNVGPKDDEMGWEIYETCRKYGAIVAQGHSHTYSRSKTLLDDAAQKVDDGCNDPLSLCVGPDKHFFFDSSLGGVDTRSLDADQAARPHWAATYTGSYGALFIEFNVDGDPKKARGYFKNIGNEVIDPPANSGKETFTITRTL